MTDMKRIKKLLGQSTTLPLGTGLSTEQQNQAILGQTPHNKKPSMQMTSMHSGRSSCSCCSGDHHHDDEEHED